MVALETPALTLELYAGAYRDRRTTLLRDGYWAGAQIFYPASATLDWGETARVSVPVGAFNSRSGQTFDGPMEAWVQRPVAGTRGQVLVGKFWVPMGLSEWQYETRPGVQWSTPESKLAVTLNARTRTPNLYGRVATKLTGLGEVGVSLAAGRGLSYSTGHNRGGALDATLAHGGWQLTSELTELHHPDRTRFRFAEAVVKRELGAWTPSLGLYRWRDGGTEQGSFAATVYSATYRVSAALSVEAASARTASGRNGWLTLHWTGKWPPTAAKE